jgi:hypothetical protein
VALKTSFRFQNDEGSPIDVDNESIEYESTKETQRGKLKHKKL